MALTRQAFVHRAQERGRHRARVFGRDARIDHRDRATVHRRHGFRECAVEIGRRPHRTIAPRALAAGERGEIDRRFAHPETDPAILDRPAAQARHPLLMQFVVEKRFVVGDDDQHRHAIVDAGPQCGQSHQVVAVAEHGHRQAIAACIAQRECRAHGHARARADAAAAIESDVVLGIREVAELARPAQRQAQI